MTLPEIFIRVFLAISGVFHSFPVDLTCKMVKEKKGVETTQHTSKQPVTGISVSLQYRRVNITENNLIYKYIAPHDLVQQSLR